MEIEVIWMPCEKHHRVQGLMSVMTSSLLAPVIETPPSMAGRFL